MSAASEHRAAQAGIRRRVALAVTGTLASITLFRSLQVRDAYAATTASIIAAGQLDAGGAAVDYVGRRVPFLSAPDLVGAFGPDGLMTAQHPGAAIGLLRMWHLLDEGASARDARDMAGSYTANLATGDMQAAQRIGLGAGALAAGLDGRRARWRKVANPNACDWCQEIAAGETYSNADGVPFHAGCNCDVDMDLAA